MGVELRAASGERLRGGRAGVRRTVRHVDEGHSSAGTSASAVAPVLPSLLSLPTTASGWGVGGHASGAHSAATHIRPVTRLWPTRTLTLPPHTTCV